MKKVVRVQIRELRQNGMGLRTIAKYTDQPLASVQYQAHKVSPTDGETDEGILKRIKNKEACAFCGKELDQPEHGRRRRFCSDQCRRRYWYIHRRDLKMQPKSIYTMVCKYCHKTFISYSNKNRKYCCHEHYILDYYGDPFHDEKDCAI